MGTWGHGSLQPYKMAAKPHGYWIQCYEIVWGHLGDKVGTYVERKEIISLYEILIPFLPVLALRPLLAFVVVRAAVWAPGKGWATGWQGCRRQCAHGHACGLAGAGLSVLGCWRMRAHMAGNRREGVSLVPTLSGLVGAGAGVGHGGAASRGMGVPGGGSQPLAAALSCARSASDRAVCARRHGCPLRPGGVLALGRGMVGAANRGQWHGVGRQYAAAWCPPFGLVARKFLV